MIRVNIGGTLYEVPEPGESPNWGREATDTIVALADVLNTLFTDGDILSTRYSISNNVEVFENVNGLLFNSNQVTSAIVTYSVNRSVAGTVITEYGGLYLNYKEDAPLDEKWSLSRVIYSGDAGIVFRCTDLGQVIYSTTDLAGLDYSGEIIFSAKVVPE